MYVLKIDVTFTSSPGLGKLEIPLSFRFTSVSSRAFIIESIETDVRRVFVVHLILSHFHVQVLMSRM